MSTSSSYVNRSASTRLAVAALALGAAALSAPARADANAEAVEYWTELGVRLVPLRRLRVTFTQNTRFAHYGLRRMVPELEVDYRVVGPLRLGAGYRYLWRNDALGEVETGHLVHGDASVQFRVRTLDIELRSRAQWRTVAEVNRGVQLDDMRSMWRNKLNLEWNFYGPLTANAFVEHWTRLDEGFVHDRFRVGAGVSAEVARWRLQLYYQRDIPDDIDQPNINMFGLSARWTLDLTRH